MSYETSPISNSAHQQSQVALPSTMKEERVINPYFSFANKFAEKRKEVEARQSGQSTESPIGQLNDTTGDDRKSAPPSLGQDPVKAEDTVKLSPQMAALARREQQFRKQQQLFEQEKKQLASEKEELAQLRQMKQKLAEKDYSDLDEIVSYDDYSQYKLNKINGSDPVQDEIKKLNGKISEIEKNAQDNISKQFEAAVSERRTAVTELVDKTDQFPRIKKAKANEAVVQHILDTWEHDNEEISVEQAAKEVEEELVQRAKSWASLLEEEKKETPVDPQAVPEKKPLPQLKPELQTKNNEAPASQPLKAPLRSMSHMSDEQRWAEARRRALAKLEANQ